MPTKRSLYYATIIYNESVKDNYIQILEDTHIPTLISPLHDKDINQDGSLKKPHRHVLLLFESLKTKEQAKEIIDAIGGVGCEIVIAPKSYARYLSHEDNPDKAQYNPDDIIALSGASEYLERITIESINKHKVIADIIRFCQDNDVDCLADIIEYALDFQPQWFIVLTTSYSSIMLTNYLKSRAWRDREKNSNLIQT